MISPVDGHCKNAPSPMLENVWASTRHNGDGHWASARDRCRRAGRRRHSGAHVRRAAAEVVSPPFNGGVADDDVGRICDMLHWLIR
jgi:hypothetical protein